MSLRLGDVVPDFEQQSTQGRIRFHSWLGDCWGVLFSHPSDFTPVCTTELGEMARLKPEFDRRNVKVIGLSVDSVERHLEWIRDIEETQRVSVLFPILADTDLKVSRLFDMIHPGSRDSRTVRSVFVIDPEKKIQLMLAYPASTGRNFKELLRSIDALQLTDRKKVATPANWRPGEEIIVSPLVTDPAELKRLFPGGVREVRPYLRYAKPETSK